MPENEVSRLIAVAREQGRADAYVGKRRWTRYAIGVRLEVTADPDKPGHTWLVRTHNISGGGLGFWSNQEVAKGLTLYVREWSETPGAPWLPGQVTYCTLGIGGYLVGVAFGAPSQPDSHYNHNDPNELAAPAVVSAPGFPGSPRSLSMQCAMRGALAGAAGVTVGGQLTNIPGLSPFWASILSLAAAIGTGSLLGWMMLRREGGFLKALRTAISELAAGTPSSIRLPPASSPELTELRQAVLDLGSRWRRHEDAERIQRERLEELTRIKSNILSIVSHDLRTPLTSILLYTRMLTDELETMPRDDQRRFLGIISDECMRLSRLLDDLLEVQRLESGRVEWNMKPQDLTEIIRASARVFEAMARNNSIEFTVSCPDQLPLLEVDTSKFAQVVSNLLSNALKYTPAGGKVQLSAEARPDHVLICVTDNGPGIPRDKWDQIFDRFSQLTSTDTREIAGVGLGLYIVREIVQRHGGRVWVDSEIGRGSEFYVSLPLDGSAVPQPGHPGGAPPGRVVFCDADPELASVACQTLRQAGFEVQVVHSAGRLLERLAQCETDVVVTDILLPDMSAPSLLDALEELEDRSFQVVLHSYDDADLPMRRETADIFLRRPASKAELVQTAQFALQRKRSPAGLAILLAFGDDGDPEPLQQALADRGHVCVSARGVGAAIELIRSYHASLLLIDSRALGLGWANLKVLESRQELSGGAELRVIVLCEELRKTERRLAEMHGVLAVQCAPGSEAMAADAVLNARQTHLPEVEE